MKETNISKILQIACTYTGAVIGAGFSSGQEIMQFFAVYGSKGLIGTVICAMLFGVLGSYLLNLGYRLNAVSYDDVIYYTCGKRTGIFLDYITGLFLFFSLAIMLAGMSSVLSSYFSVSSLSTILFSGLLTGVIVITGLKGIEAANAVIIPILILLTATMGIYSFSYHDYSLAFLSIPCTSQPPIPHFLLACFLYTAYNMLLGSTVLGPLGAHTQSRRVRTLGGISGGLILGIMMITITITILIHLPAIEQYEIPMLYIASIQSSQSYTFYTIILFGAMITTAISALFGCGTKLTNTFNITYSISLIIILIGAVAIGTIGFTKLINLLYPFFGLISSYFTIMLFFHAARDMIRRSKRQ